MADTQVPPALLLQDDDPATLVFRKHEDVTPAALVPGIKQLDFTGDNFSFAFKKCVDSTTLLL